MFTELYKELGLTIDTVPSYIFVIRYYYTNEYCYYLVPLSDVSNNELSILENYNGEYWNDDDYTIQVHNLFLKFEQYETKQEVIKANIVAIYNK